MVITRDNGPTELYSSFLHTPAPSLQKLNSGRDVIMTMAERDICDCLRRHMCDDAAGIVLDYARREPAEKVNDWIRRLRTASFESYQCCDSARESGLVFMPREPWILSVIYRFINIPGLLTSFCWSCRSYSRPVVYEARYVCYGTKTVCFRKHAADIYHMIVFGPRLYSVPSEEITTRDMADSVANGQRSAPNGMRADIQRVLAEW